MTNPLFKKIENWIKGKVTDVEQETLKLGTSAAHYVETTVPQVGRDAASAAVIAAEATPGGGQAKFAAAVASVTAVLVKEGLPVVEAGVETLIQMAVADAKLAGLIN